MESVACVLGSRACVQRNGGCGRGKLLLAQFFKNFGFESFYQVREAENLFEDLVDTLFDK
jgi:hypothetical protein